LNAQLSSLKAVFTQERDKQIAANKGVRLDTQKVIQNTEECLASLEKSTRSLRIFRFIKYETGSDTITDFNLGDGDKIDLRGLLADTGFSLDKLSLYLNLSGDLGQQTLKVDTLGSGNFGSPDLTVVMSNPSGINDGLSTLIDQRVFMV
jgi:hypothetical protein